jgi:hypothetical protein
MGVHVRWFVLQDCSSRIGICRQNEYLIVTVVQGIPVTEIKTRADRRPGCKSDRSAQPRDPSRVTLANRTGIFPVAQGEGAFCRRPSAKPEAKCLEERRQMMEATMASTESNHARASYRPCTFSIAPNWSARCGSAWPRTRSVRTLEGGSVNVSSDIATRAEGLPFSQPHRRSSASPRWIRSASRMDCDGEGAFWRRYTPTRQTDGRGVEKSPACV